MASVTEGLNKYLGNEPVEQESGTATETDGNTAMCVGGYPMLDLAAN